MNYTNWRAPIPRCRLLVTTVILAVASQIPMGVAEVVDFEERRAALVARHDKNGDGRLDSGELEQMRLSRKEGPTRGKSANQIPADFLAQYDSNKNGEMEGEEWKTAWEAETKILTETYDADKDKTLGQKEQQAMMADVKNGKITGMRAFFAGRMVNDKGSVKAGHLETQKELLQFDADGNGLASAAELERIRKSREKLPVPTKSP